MKSIVLSVVGVIALTGCAKDHQINNSLSKINLQPIEYADVVNHHFRTNSAFLHEGTDPTVNKSEIAISKRFIIEPLEGQFENIQLSLKDYCEKRDMEWVEVDNLQPAGGFYSCETSPHPYTSKHIDFVYHIIPMIEDTEDWKENIISTPRYYFTIHQPNPNWPTKRFFDHSLHQYYNVMREGWREDIHFLRPDHSG